VAGVERRLSEAEAALTTLEEAVGTEPRSLLERDSAILRLIYSFEAVWKACQQLLAEFEDSEVAPPNTTIRAARRLGWLSDEDAAAP
jgi:Nucleotidyltransferase substrate binding protein like